MRLNNRLMGLAVAVWLAPASQAIGQDGPPQSDAPQATSDRSADRYDEVGYATWYGGEYRGSRTASGAPFDPDAFTAAHRTLPLGSYVEVTSLDTGRTVLVKVTDRGPFTPGLRIDLSQAAAQAIGIKSRAAVRIRRVTPNSVDQTALNNGQAASPRLDTPLALLAGLRAKLTGGPAIDTTAPVLTPTRNPVARPTAPIETPAALKGGYYIQQQGSRDGARQKRERQRNAVQQIVARSHRSVRRCEIGRTSA
jgi:rare lipoprotein A